MPEKIIIGEIDIDMEKALADTIELKKQVGLLKALQKEAKETVGEASTEYIQYSAQLKATTSQLRSHENMLAKTVEAEKSEIGSLDQLRARLSVVSKEWSKLSKEERLNSDHGKKLTAEKLSLTNALKKEEIATGDARRNVGNYVQALQSVPGPIGRATTAAKGFIATMGKFGLIGTAITAVIAAISLPLIAFFKKSEKGFELMERKVAGFKAQWNVLVGAVIEGGEKISDALDKPEKKMGLLARAVLALGQQVGSVKLMTLATEMDIAGKAAENYTAKLQELDDLQRGMIVQRAQTNKQIAQAKLNYEDETKAIDTRLESLKTSLNLEIQMNDTEIAHQKEVVKQIQAVNEEKKKANQLRDDDLLKLEEAKAKEIELETESLIKRRKLQSTINKATEELSIETKRIAAEKANQIMRDELEVWVDNEKKKLAISGEIKQKYDELETTHNLNRLEAIKVDAENQQAILEQTLFGQLDVEKAAMDKKKAIELANAEKTGASILLIEKKYAKAEKAIETAKRDAKLALAQGVAQAVAELFGESTAAGKAAAVAMTTIETFRGAQAAFTGMVETFPGPWGIAAGILAAAGAVAIGIANVKKILAVDPKGSGGGGISAATGGGTQASPPALTSNLVNTQTSIGQGIVAREVTTELATTPTREVILVVDDVNAAQKTESVKTKTSTL